MQLGFILSILFAIIVTIFALLNSDPVNINFLFANVEISQALVIFISAGFGAVIFAILGFYRNLKVKLNLNKSNKQIKTLESENTELKTKVEDLEASIAILEAPIPPVTEDVLEDNVENEPLDTTETVRTEESIKTEENIETE